MLASTVVAVEVGVLVTGETVEVPTPALSDVMVGITPCVGGPGYAVGFVGWACTSVGAAAVPGPGYPPATPEGVGPKSISAAVAPGSGYPPGATEVVWLWLDRGVLVRVTVPCALLTKLGIFTGKEHANRETKPIKNKLKNTRLTFTPINTSILLASDIISEKRALSSGHIQALLDRPLFTTYTCAIKNMFNTHRYTILYFLFLFAGLGWIWFSKASPGSTTNGAIPAPQKGFLAPDFSLESSTGEVITLSSLRGQPVLINIWASWCPPCRAEMPAMQRVYQDYQAQGLIILAVNATNQDRASDALDFAQQNGLSFPILFDTTGDVSRQYRIRALPTSFFVDTNGIIREVVIGGPMSEALLRIRVQQTIEQQSPGAP